MRLLTPVVLLLLCFTVCALEVPRNNTTHKVLILGGGVAGIIAARTLHQRGIEDFIIIEARPELGGRLMSTKFGNLSKGKKYVIETGANWIQGTQQDNGPANPVYQLAKKHGLQSQFNDWFGSVCKFQLCLNFPPTLLTFGTSNVQCNRCC